MNNKDGAPPPGRAFAASIPSAATVTCPRCNAKPLYPCVAVSDKGGNWHANTHAARFKAAGIASPTYDDKRQAIADFEYAKVQRHRLKELNSPYSRGYRAGVEGKAAPAFSLGNATWDQRLYERGWLEGRSAPNTDAKQPGDEK